LKALPVCSHLARQQPADYFVGNSGASDAIWQEGNFGFSGPYLSTIAQER
jgi:hypothetical protein